MTTSTDTSATADRGPQDDPGPDRNLVALIGAAALVVVVVVLVLIFGIARPPALPSLAEQPFAQLEAGVAWGDWDGDRQCLFVARPDGVTDRVTCDRDGSEVIAWDADGVVRLSWDAREELAWYDPASGDRVKRESLGDDGDGFGGGSAGDVYTEREDGELVVRRDDTDDIIWSVAAPDTYHVRSGGLSPDGAWVAMVDSAERLLVVPADGSEEPRVWAEVASAWERPVWEGTEVPPGADR